MLLSFGWDGFGTYMMATWFAFTQVELALVRVVTSLIDLGWSLFVVTVRCGLVWSLGPFHVSGFVSRVFSMYLV